MKLRDHTFLGTTQSLCPECLALVPAKIITRGKRVYFRKRCPTHGLREDFVCSDVSLYDQMQYSLPGKVPALYGVEPEKGCPYDCGLCTEHEQHTCVGLVEMTTSCNLRCPMCFSSSGPGGTHLSYEACVASIDRLVAVEGRAEVLQLSGGEPTVHPDFLRVLEYAAARPIDVVMVNTNGIRLAHDPEMLDRIERLKDRVEVYFQFDGFDDRASVALRGEPLVETKLKAIEALGRRGIKTSLVCTLQPGVNDHEVGAIVNFGLERPWITGVSFQPATYSGRHVLPDDLERRVTFPDVIRAIAEQTGGVFREDDFMPLPCAHPNCHSLTYAFRAGGRVVPLSRFIDARKHLEILANGILFSRNRARQLIEQYLAGVGGCRVGCGPPGDDRGGDGGPADPVEAAAADFFARALTEQLAQSDVFRITITSFLDAYNFDVRRLMKCCIHHVLPSGHVIPFCAYNVLYREGHVVLPALRDAGLVQLAGPARREVEVGDPKTRDLRCPRCGLPAPPGQARCSVCDEPLSAATGWEAVGAPAPLRIPGTGVPASVLLAVALFLIVVGVGREHTGLGVLILLVGVPALLLAFAGPAVRGGGGAAGVAGPGGKGGGAPGYLVFEPPGADRGSPWGGIATTVVGVAAFVVMAVLLFCTAAVAVTVFLFYSCLKILGNH